LRFALSLTQPAIDFGFIAIGTRGNLAHHDAYDFDEKHVNAQHDFF
jgi:hypothetical protein